tara:strand:+ start:397 stop:783 length:387 start_codon:yes stop_codon:yes gene_type:complete
MKDASLRMLILVSHLLLNPIGDIKEKKKEIESRFFNRIFYFNRILTLLEGSEIHEKFRGLKLNNLSSLDFIELIKKTQATYLCNLDLYQLQYYPLFYSSYCSIKLDSRQLIRTATMKQVKKIDFLTID